MNIKTKIVCTIGPATWSPEVMKKMIAAGMNCARVNGAFADEAELDKVKKLIKDIDPSVVLMLDVKGPEVRLNKFPEAKKIEPGSVIVVGNSSDDSEIYPANYKDLYKSLEAGQRIVIGDGDVELKIESINGDKMYCVVVFGELLKPGKAMNLPGASISTSPLTERDIINLKHAIATGWEYLSASFIQTKDSALEVKKYLENTQMQLIAKIEDQQGVDNIDEILEVVDGIMVARGGLGVELGLEHVPMIQRHLIERANNAGKSVITATQMLVSMINNPRPTRAEVHDIATGIMIGTDSIMVSDESTVGKYPVEAVEWMTKTAGAVEEFVRVRRYDNIDETLSFNQEHNDDLGRSAIAITNAAVEACINLDIKAVLVLTKTGFSAKMLSRHKLQQPIYAFVSESSTAQSLKLTGGVYPIIKSDIGASRDEAIAHMLQFAVESGVVEKGDLVAIVIGSKTFTGVDSSVLEIQRAA